MKKYFILSLCFVSLFSCNNEVDDYSVNNNYGQELTIKMDDSEAQKEFARILSKAVYNNVEIRQFLKDEALKQFDNDYDVFYPFIKDKEVTNGITFRDMLLNYCENENILLQIEQSMPLLNILVPDLTLFSDFSAESWDINDNEVAVSYIKGNENNVLYGDGDIIATLDPNEIPGFPVLVIKPNERMEAKAIGSRAAGGTEYTYSFVSDAFNGQLRSQTRSSWDIYPTQDPTTAYVSASELDPLVIAAYQEFKNNNKAVDRDYIYYGLSNAKPNNGTLNTNMREILYKFKIDANKYYAIADQDGDPKLNGSISNKKTELSNDEIIRRIWTEGNFEIIFNVYVGKRDEKSIPNTLSFSVPARELFQIEKIHVDKRHKTAFRHTKYTYTVKPENLKSKWVSARKFNGTYPELSVEPWDVANQSLTINMAIYEKDESQTIKKQYSVKTEYTNKVDFSAGLNGGGSGGTTKALGFSLKLGYGFSSTTTRTEAMEIVTQKESDDLGTLSMSFYDPIITAYNSNGYLIRTVNNGAVEAMIFPKRIR